MGKKQKHSDHPTLEELRQELYKANEAMNTAYDRFNWADDPDIIDACIFEISALNARYNCAVKNIRNME